MLKQRVITALILGLLLLAALFWLPAAGWAVLVLAVVALGAFEWGRLAGLSASSLALYAVALAGMLAAIIGYGVASAHQAVRLQLALYALAVVFWLVVVPPWLARGWRPGRGVLLLIGCVVLLPAGLAMNELRAHSPATLLFFLALVWMADTAAYFSGKKFGRRKLAPAISPGKTWEGAVGALLGVTLYVVLVGALSLHMHGLGGYLKIVATGWVLVIISVEGDLFESSIKRQAGVKDSGALLPGHGGMLDRIDALTSALPLAGLIMVLNA